MTMSRLTNSSSRAYFPPFQISSTARRTSLVFCSDIGYLLVLLLDEELHDLAQEEVRSGVHREVPLARKLDELAVRQGRRDGLGRRFQVGRTLAPQQQQGRRRQIAKALGIEDVGRDGAHLGHDRGGGGDR